MKQVKTLRFVGLLGVAIAVSPLYIMAQNQPPAASRPAYYVAEFQATDPDGIKPYSAKVESTFKPFSGRFIVRGGELDVKEGFGAQGRLVMIKFDSLVQAQAWYNSPGYQAIIPIRHRSGNTRAYIVEGMPE
jgi:uncharacterized protein (DUF1330 family)